MVEEMDEQSLDIVRSMLKSLKAQAQALTLKSKLREYECYRDNVKHYKKVFGVFYEKAMSDCDKIIDKINHDLNPDVLANEQR